MSSPSKPLRTLTRFSVLPAPRGGRSRFPALLVLVALAIAQLQTAAAAEFDFTRLTEFDFTRLTEDVDVAFRASDNPASEFMANFEFGRVEMNLQHVEYLRGMRGPNLYGGRNTNRLVRSSLMNTGSLVDLGPEADMPLGLSLAFDERVRGNRELRLTARNGLRLSELQLDHSLTVIDSFAADGTESRRSAGRLLLGFDLFGGHHEGLMEYDAAPLTQATHLNMTSEWRFAGGRTAVVGFSHRPLVEIAETRLGFRQPIGAFQMTSDLVADSQGGYALGLGVSLPLGPAPKAESWNLSSLISTLRAERLPEVSPSLDDLPLYNN